MKLKDAHLSNIGFKAHVELPHPCTWDAMNKRCTPAKWACSEMAEHADELEQAKDIYRPPVSQTPELQQMLAALISKPADTVIVGEANAEIDTYMDDQIKNLNIQLNSSDQMDLVLVGALALLLVAVCFWSLCSRYSNPNFQFKKSPKLIKKVAPKRKAALNGDVMEKHEEKISLASAGLSHLHTQMDDNWDDDGMQSRVSTSSRASRNSRAGNQLASDELARAIDKMQSVLSQVKRAPSTTCAK